MNSLVLSEIDFKNFENNEIIYVMDEYYIDFLREKKIKNEINLTSPSFKTKDERILALDTCEKIYQRILKDLSISLNNLHNIKFNSRSWEIIFGNWLRYFVWICYERYYYLKQIIKNKKINKIYYSKNDNFIFALNNTESIAFASINDTWNSNFYNKIIEYQNFDCKKIFFVSKEKNKVESYKNVNKEENYIQKIIKKILNNLKFIKSQKDGVIINTYLPTFYEKILELSFLQIPKNWRLKKIKYNTFNQNLREKIILKKNLDKSLENFIRVNIKNFLPISTVESFYEIIQKTKMSGLPEKPKFIFTSNDFENNEILKFYVALKTREENTKYIIGQHGNTYFTDLRSDKFRSEFNFSDKFLTWGYNTKEKFQSAFNFTSIGKKKYKACNKNKLLAIVSPLEFRMFPFNTISQTEKGFVNSIDIINGLKKTIYENTVLRLHPSFKTRRGEYYINKYFNNKNFNINFGEKPFSDARSSSKITFFNYDSTGILENLVMNYPTVCMWEDIYENINNNLSSKYKNLCDAKILFFNKEDLISHLNSVWENIDDWWFDRKTQSLINEFNNNFNKQGNLFSIFKMKKQILN